MLELSGGGGEGGGNFPKYDFLPEVKRIRGKLIY